MATLTAAVEDGEWGDKAFLLSLAGRRIVSLDTKDAAEDTVARLNEIIAERVDEVLAEVFRQDTLEGATAAAALREKLIGPQAPEEEVEPTEAEKRQRVYVLLNHRARLVLMYCAAGKLAHANLKGGEVIDLLKNLGLYKTGGVVLGDELTAWGLEIAASLARHNPTAWAKIQDGTFVPKVYR